MTTPDQYKALSDRYPAFAYAALMALRGADSEETRRRLRSRLADNIGDNDALREILGEDSESLADFYPDALQPALDTDATIDAFISRFGADQPLPPAVREIAEQAEPDDNPEPLEILRILENPEPPGNPKPADSQQPQESPAAPESGGLSMSFAKILIKNGNYAKALDIISELNLKFPEKSIYFADQMRFLKKLIKISKLNKT